MLNLETGKKQPLSGKAPPIGPFELIRGCVTSFFFYRRLADRPLGFTFRNLAFLVLAVTLILGGRDVYFFNRRYLGRVYSLVEGRLSHIVIRAGRVEMEDDYFLLEEEHSYPAGILKRRISLDRAAPEEVTAPVLEWLEETFPDPDREITPSEVARKIEERPGLEPEAEDYLRDRSDFGRFVFKVDLTGEDPGFPPRSEGFLLTRDEVHFQPFADFADREDGDPAPAGFLGRPMARDLESLTGERTYRLDDETLDRWRRLAGWIFSPLLLVLFYILYFVSRIFQALVGCAVAALACSGTSRLKFPALFAISVHALIPAVILGVIDRLLPAGMAFFVVIFFAVYFFYVWKATRAVCVQR